MIKLFIGILFFCSLFFQTSDARTWWENYPTNVTVAQDGSGNFETIGAAIEAAPNNSETSFYIKIRPGLYRENIYIGRKKWRLALIGEDMYKTVITGNRSNGTGYRTYDTATAGINGEHFMAIGITFENDAGPENKQAVALRSNFQSAFYKCRFLGYQDTLYAVSGRQFYRECHIYGTIDFIWGNAAVVFQECAIFVCNPLQKQYNTITAQGRKRPTENTGTVLHKCYINGTKDFDQSAFKTYLGRPWKTYSRVVIIQTFINDLIDRQGWVKWDKKTQMDKCYYAEYQNEGPGSTNSTTGRVGWPGVKIIKSYEEAAIFSVRNFIKGDTWIPSTGIPFTLDFYVRV